jgi:hypothetical protein
MRLLGCFLLASSLWAADGISTPSIGYALDPAGTLERVSGISGAFRNTLTDRTGVRGAAFSARLGVLKLEDSVVLVDVAGNTTAESPATSGAALFGFDAAGTSVAAWYPDARTLSVYRNEAWTVVPYDPGGATVLAVALDSESAVAAIRRDGLSVVRIRISDGATEEDTPIGESKGPALLTPGGSSLVFQRGDVMVVRSSGGEATRPLSDPIAGLVAMSDTWIQVRTEAGASLALRLSATPTLWRLPRAQNPTPEVEQ